MLRNQNCGPITNEAVFGDSIVRAVDYLKYLGYWLGTKGKIKNDEHIKAQATQLRFKIRALRPVIGEHLSLVYLNSYATPSILHGAELGNLSAEKLDEYQSWSLSDALGLGRAGKSHGLMEADIRRICIYADYNWPTWSQIRAKSAMVTYRSIMRM